MDEPSQYHRARWDDSQRRHFEAALRGRLVDIYRSNPWLVAVDVDQGAVGLAARLRSMTETPVLALAARSGVGPVDPSIPLHSLGLPSTGEMVSDIHTAAEAFRNPPPADIDAVDRWDRDGRARAVCAITAIAGPVVGRPTFGARPQAWADLEDKLAIEELWAEVGVPVAPSVQVAVEDSDGLLAAHRRLATDGGTVWAGDNSSGWHGGGHGTHWVPDEAAAEAMAPRLDRYRLVRIMPFVEGIPCSIHGMVVPDGGGGAAVAMFRPTEMMILRNPARSTFVYGRSGTLWDPPAADRTAMQAVARRIGDGLWHRVGYRGAFTVDGILGAAGFVPSEVNTRYGSALGFEMETIDGPPLDLFLIHLALVEGLLDGLDPVAFERWATDNLDRNRRARGFLDVDLAPDRERTAVVTRSPAGALTVDDRDGDEPVEAGDAAPDRVAEVRWGTARGGGMLMIEIGPVVEVGAATAPLLVEIIDAVDRHWGVGIPALAPARPVR